MLKQLITALAIGSLCILGVQKHARAFKLTPISQSFAPFGQEANRSYEVYNDSQERIAVEVSIVERYISLEGEESHAPAEDDFLVYPAQIILEPGATQVVRVSWLGDASPIQELAYRIIAEQLPIQLVDHNAEQSEQPEGQVNILLRYIGSLFVKPEGAASDVVLETASIHLDQLDHPQLLIKLHNQGTASTTLRNLNLQVTAQGVTVELTPEELTGMAGERLLANSSRQFIIDWPEGLPTSSPSVSFEFDRSDQ